MKCVLQNQMKRIYSIDNTKLIYMRLKGASKHLYTIDKFYEKYVSIFKIPNLVHQLRIKFLSSGTWSVRYYFT